MGSITQHTDPGRRRHAREIQGQRSFVLWESWRERTSNLFFGEEKGKNEMWPSTLKYWIKRWTVAAARNPIDTWNVNLSTRLSQWLRKRPSSVKGKCLLVQSLSHIFTSAYTPPCRGLLQAMWNFAKSPWDSSIKKSINIFCPSELRNLGFRYVSIIPVNFVPNSCSASVGRLGPNFYTILKYKTGKLHSGEKLKLGIYNCVTILFAHFIMGKL